MLTSVFNFMGCTSSIILLLNILLLNTFYLKKINSLIYRNFKANSQLEIGYDGWTSRIIW